MVIKKVQRHSLIFFNKKCDKNVAKNQLQKKKKKTPLKTFFFFLVQKIEHRLNLLLHQ